MDELIISLASDGRDNTSHAGALADIEVKDAAVRLGEDIETHLLAHDAHPFFEKVGGAIITGYTGSNVSDLILAMRH